MEPIDIVAIERRARQMRAQEIQRITGLFGERMRVYLALVLASLWLGVLATARALQALFSWNPRSRPVDRSNCRNWAARANSALRGLFAWNPRHTHTH
jgi:hypothetical protein